MYRAKMNAAALARNAAAIGHMYDLGNVGIANSIETWSHPSY